MRRIFLLTFMLMAAVFARAQEATPLSLEDCMNYAAQHSATAKNARLDVLQQIAKNSEVTGLALPHLSAKGEFDHYIAVPKQYIPGSAFGLGDTVLEVSFALKNSVSASATASQVLFDGSVLVALQARNTLVKLAQQNEQLSQEELRYNIQKAYFAIVIAQRQFGILKNSLAAARDIAHDVNVMRENGFAEKIEVDRTDVQINNLATDSLRIGNLLTLSEQLLKYRIGMDINQPIVLTDTVVETTITEAQSLLNTDVDYSNRTDYNLLQTQMKLNEYDLKRYKLAGLPTLSAFLSAGYLYSNDEFRELFLKKYPFNSMVGLQLSVPVFDGLQRHYRVKQAKLTLEKTQNNLNDLKLGIDLQSAQSHTTLKNSLLAMRSQERNVDLANSVLDLSRKKYKAGVGSNLEVNQAQTDLLNAQNNYFNSLLDVINAQADLQKALGLFKQ